MLRIFLICVLSLTTLSACETAKGVGRDLQKVGNTVSNTAQDVQQAF